MTISWSGLTKRALIALALILLIPTLTYVRDAHAALVQGYLAARWLQMPVATTPDNKPITRIQIIDAVLEREAAQLQLKWLAKPAN